MVHQSLDQFRKDLQILDVVARVPNRDDAGTPHTHRMLAAGLIASAIHGRVDVNDPAALEREIAAVVRIYAGVLEALDRIAPPPPR